MHAAAFASRRFLNLKSARVLNGDIVSPHNAHLSAYTKAFHRGLCRWPAEIGESRGRKARGGHAESRLTSFTTSWAA